MLFNSIDFAVFLPLVFAIYWALPKNSKAQNTVLLCASLIFYGWWDYRFLGLILFSSIVDFAIGLRLHTTETVSRRKALLRLSLFINLGLLGFFKYFNFFQESFVNAFNFFGSSIEGYDLNIVLPVGISFYTFQTLSYTIDIYRKEIKPVPRFIDFATFVTFFPQLVAGPIERASKMLPQLEQKRSFRLEQGKAGIQLIIFGLFRKIVIADNLGMYVDRVWEYPEAITPYMAVFASIFFSVQIYMDFSGYSRIARGVAKLFGIELMVNFNYPYKARTFGEFWSRWHISLSTWFRDYLYIPLGGNRKGNLHTMVNLGIVFTISGLWHGAAWTFVLWGVLHFVMLSAERVVKIQRSKFADYLLWVKTLGYVNLSWILFRAPSFGDALIFISKFLEPHKFIGINSLTFQSPFALALDLFLIGSLPYLLRLEQNFERFSEATQITVYSALIVFMSTFYSSGQSFIYFQF